MPTKRIKFDIKSGDLCPYCKMGKIVKRKGKYGYFFGCTAYPYCAFVQEINEEKIDKIEASADQFLLSHGIKINKI